MIKKVIVGNRQSGKTTELIKMSAKNNIYILVANYPRAYYLFQQARDMGYEIPFPVTLHEYLYSNRFVGSIIRRDGLYIDDVEDVLTELFKPIEIKAITVTKYNFTTLEGGIDMEKLDEKIQKVFFGEKP